MSSARTIYHTTFLIIAWLTLMAAPFIAGHGGKAEGGLWALLGIGWAVLALAVRPLPTTVCHTTISVRDRDEVHDE